MWAFYTHTHTHANIALAVSFTYSPNIAKTDENKTIHLKQDT